MIEHHKPGPLKDGSVIAIVGAGPAGCFSSLLAQHEARARGIRIRPLLFDGKSFLQEGPRGCNMCAGVISWNLAREIEDLGLRLPRDRVQRLIRSYVFHTKEGSHSVIPPPGRGPIPVVFRGNGPRFSQETGKISFDDFLLEQTLERGAEIIRSHVTSLSLHRDPNKRPTVHWKTGSIEADLIVVACGVSSSFGRQLADSGMEYGISRKSFHAYQLACRPVLSDRYYGWLMQMLAGFFRLTDTVDALLSVAKQDSGLRLALFQSVSGEEPYRKIFREGFQVSRMGRLLHQLFREKILPAS